MQNDRNDVISRQEAIDAIFGRSHEIIKMRIGNLPSARPERKRGKWVYAEDEYGIDGYHCNQCGFFVPWDYAHKFINYIEDYNFCPHCGADMRKDEQE